RFLRIHVLDLTRKHPFPRLIFLHDQAPDAGQESRNAFDPPHAPRFHLLQWPHEHLVTTKRIRAVDFYDVDRIDHVAPAFRHFAAVLAQDHALIDQALEWLGSREVPEIEEHFVPKPGVKKMQHRMLNPADVKIDAPRLRWE